MIATVLALVPVEWLRQPISASSPEWLDRRAERVRFNPAEPILAPERGTRLRLSNVWPVREEPMTGEPAFVLGVALQRQSFARNVDAIPRQPLPEYVDAALTLLSEEFLKPGTPLGAESVWELSFTDDDGAQVAQEEGQFRGLNRLGMWGNGAQLLDQQHLGGSESDR